MPDIFISYRREDTSGYAGRLYDQVSAHFGRDHVFMDVAAIEPGSDFAETIEKRVSTCDALIALIGKNWLTIADEQNHVRLGNQGDFVSIEVAAALKRNVEVIPVLVGGAKMPLQRQLPESLQLLSRRQALEISDVHFIRDVADLIDALKKPSGAPAAALPRWIKPALAILLCVVAIVLGIWIWQNKPHSRESVTARGSAPLEKMVRSAGSSPTGHSANVSGNWKAVVQKESVRYEIYFTFEVLGDKLFGKAIYPTGEGGILNGTIGQGTISFTTKHVPNFADKEATIKVEGKLSNDEIEILVQDEDGYAKGVAHRVTRVGQPRVLTPR